MASKIEELIGNLIRDVTRAGFMPKSEARRRMLEIYTLGREEGQFETEKSCQRDYVQLLEEAEREAKQQGIKIGIEKAVEKIKYLMLYAQHSWTCSISKKGVCNCGLDELLSSLTSDETLKK